MCPNGFIAASAALNFNSNIPIWLDNLRSAECLDG